VVVCGRRGVVVVRLNNFVTPFFKHLATRLQREKALAYLKGLLSSTEKKNIESIAYFHGEVTNVIRFKKENVDKIPQKNRKINFAILLRPANIDWQHLRLSGKMTGK
jgi:hypothetical protein